MLDRILGHYKSSLTGVALGVFQIVLNGRSTKDFALAIVTLLLGLLSKDK